MGVGPRVLLLKATQSSLCDNYLLFFKRKTCW